MRRALLLPFAPLYSVGVALRNLRIEKGWNPVKRLRWPVISIGNLSTGGTGKTPLTIALAKVLTERGFNVDVLSRGYGRETKEPARVRPEGTVAEFGDEPLLIAREAGVPVYVGAQRYEAGLLAEAKMEASGQHDARQGRLPYAHLLDDGFQHRQLARDTDILLLNRADWCDSLLPAGDLREPIRALRRASVIAIPSDDLELESELRAWGWQEAIWRLVRRMEVPRVDGPVIAFCGIARPEQFFAGLESAGLQMAVRKVFRDHHAYTDSDVQNLIAKALGAGAKALVTTGKDAVRLGGLASAFPAGLPVKTARLTIEIEEEGSAIDSLAGRLRDAQRHPSL